MNFDFPQPAIFTAGEEQIPCFFWRLFSNTAALNEIACMRNPFMKTAIKQYPLVN